MRNHYREDVMPMSFKDYRKFLEWQEARDEAKAKKKEEADKKKKDIKPSRAFTFAEGMILAYVLQFIIGPMYKVFLVHLGVQ